MNLVPHEEGGGPACLLHQVCPECGRIRERPTDPGCPHCAPPPGGAARSRDRDAEGRARNARPRDGLGRPLPYGQEGVPRQSEGVIRTPAQTLAEAQRLFAEGMPFHAHEVLEDAWKSAPADERPLWKGLAQMAVGVTHALRGNTTGGARLLRRGADAVEPYVSRAPHGLDLAALVAWARDRAVDVERHGVPEGGDLVPRLRREGGEEGRERH
ncbi:DUF309 domain-containing protein [Streptomyces sp. NPDC093097]|uniref:DUF309 domain-containing protein n=1 Tax=Streptomyces sp. NPDC093097 TaxID=3366027 RepID=UPI00380DA3C8